MTQILIGNPTKDNSPLSSDNVIPVTFWYHLISSHKVIRNQEGSEYEPNLISIGSCDNMNDFWSIFQHIKKPSDHMKPFDYQIFKQGIKPMWEDSSNKNGGKLSILVSKSYSSLLWEETVFAFVGGVLPYITEINGITISSRKMFNIIQIWYQTFDKELISKIRKEMKLFFQMPMCLNMPSKAFSGNDKESD